MLLLVSSIKLIAEIALMAFAGQWLLGLFAGARRDSNIVYQLLRIVTNPFVLGVRRITPRGLRDRHVPIAAFALLAMVWVVATIGKVSLCLQIGVQACR